MAVAGGPVLSTHAEVTLEKKDRYRRTAARVNCHGGYIDVHQVREGTASVYRHHSKDAALLALEEVAHAVRRGLWADKDPVPPWSWRRKR